MKEEKIKDTDEKFREYFRNTFLADKRELIQEFGEEDFDLEYNFKKEKSVNSENIFEIIYRTFSEGKYKEFGTFLSNLDLLSENKEDKQFEKSSIKNNKKEETEISDFGKNGEYYRQQIKETENKNLEEKFDGKNKFSEIDLKNAAYIMSSVYPHELYAALNDNSEKNDKIILTEISEYGDFNDSYEKMQHEMKSKEITGLQKLYSSGLSIFNKVFFEEFISDILKHRTKNILKSYMFPFFSFPRKVILGEGSSNDLTDTVFKIYEDDRLYNIIKDRKDFKSECDNVKRTVKKEFYYTDFNKIDKIDKVKENFGIKTLDTYTEILDFNMNNHLKEYKQLKPLLDKYNIKKMTKRSLKNLYEDNNRLFKNLEKKLGKKPSDATKNMILNKIIINEFMKKKLEGKTCILIDDMKNSFFGLKVPVINGKIDTDFINLEFDILNQESRNNLIKIAEKFADSKTRIVKQLIKTDRGLFDFNDREDEIRDLIFNKIGLEIEEDIADIITDTEKLEEILNKNSSVYIFNGANYEFRSRLDKAVIKMLEPFISRDSVNVEKIVSYINENSIIKDSRPIYEDDFEEFSENISENPDFKMEETDLYKLKQNKSQISKLIGQNIPVDNIIDKYKFKDKSNMAFILGAFKQSLNINESGKILKKNPKVKKIRENRFKKIKNYDENFIPSFKDSFFKDEPDFEILREQSSYVRNKASEFFEMIGESQERINSFNFKNQEIFNENFDNIMKNKSRINLIKEVEKTKIDIENMKFFGQNSGNMRKINFLKMRLRSMENKLTSTTAVKILLKNKTIGEKDRDILKITDKYYIESLKYVVK
ncbi:MAG: hypothetical protein Q4D53_06925 [Leptotrichiaceae bacterium]|nr:hypothetical protein [Leptotrichiaceae bacterium]